MMLGNSDKSKLGLKNKNKKYVGNGEINFNFDSSHSSIVKLINEGKKVLDLGCSDGIIGNYLSRYKKCEVYGCDIDDESIQIAKSRNCYKKVFHADLDSDKILDKSLKFNYFDYVVIADVIEHLRNPENIIEIACKYLNNNGEILICVPNVTHENIIINLLNERFNYNDLGILDNTHLRFFTENSFIDFINNLNTQLTSYSLKCELVKKIQLYDEKDYNDNQEIINLIDNKNFYTLQLIFRIRKVEKGFVNSYNEIYNNTQLIEKRIQIEKDILVEDISSLSIKNNRLEKENKELRNLINQKNTDIHYLQSINNEYNYKMYRLASSLRKIMLNLFPYGSFRRKIVSVVKKVIKRIFLFFVNIAKYIFKFFTTKKFRRKILRKIKYHKVVSKLVGVVPFSYYLTDYIEIEKNNYPIEKIYVTNKSIGVHLHLYYIDLADEFVNYLSNIPYQFDLYISVSDKEYIYKIKRKFNRILNLNKLVIKVSKNSGRDFGPMFVLFGEYLKNYDYILHIHSKKSLRTGSEQDGWRNYLLRSILGSPARVVNIFSQMENYDIGIVYQDDYLNCPHWGHTWLGAAGHARNYLKKLGIKFEDTYLEFSAGSMFFAKTDAIRQLFDLNLTWEDFGIEENKSDGTLAYFFERIFVLLAQKNQYSFSVYNEKYNKFLYNYSEKGFDKYKENNIDSVFEHLNKYKIITFDIFDTLITRKIYNPDDIYHIIENKLPICKEMLPNGLLKLRKEAESLARDKYKQDVNIHQIYSEFSELSNLDSATIEKIKNMEIDLELDLCIPRIDMLKIYNKLLENNKQIILISDMYLTKEIIGEMLEKCGYRNYFDLLISCEVNKRKDTGSMWKYFFDKYQNSLTIHIGDNEQSDIHIPCNLGKNFFHIMQGKKMYQLSSFYYKENLNYDTKILQGLLINKCLFNSPFYDKKYSLPDLGYGIIGPLLLKFAQYIREISNNYDEILFFSREGYYLEKIYKKLYPDDNRVKYFLISRRAITVANIQNKEDIMKIFNTNYKGSIKKLFYHRLGVYLDNIDDIEVCCPSQNNIVKKYIEDNFEIILNNSRKERENYLRYIDKKINNTDSKILVVDLGYSGTSQYELSKLINKKIDGAYFIVSDNLKPLSLGCKVFSCYNDVIYDNSFDKNPLGRYSLILESFLTSPDGQLVCFKENSFPKFLYESKKGEIIKLLDKIYEGIINFIDDYLSINNKNINEIDINKKFLVYIFQQFIESKKFNEEMVKTFKVEDLYCGNNILDVMSQLF